MKTALPLPAVPRSVVPKARRFELPAPQPFSLDPVSRLSCGFLRGTRATCGVGRVKLAFPLDGTFELTGVTLKLSGNRLEGEVSGGAPVNAVKRQVARILGLDRDASAFSRVLEADPVLREVAAKSPGFRPVVSYSPYVMAGWSVLSQRLRMSQAAALQVKLAEAVGDVVDVDGDRVASFPRPQSLLQLTAFEGLQPEKLTRLKAVAAAALEGQLDLATLTQLPHAEARARLLKIRGVGPWTADAVLIRGCGPSDLLPLSEPTLHGAVANAYGLKSVPSDAEVEALARGWAPFRTWVSVLLIAHDFGAASARARGGRPRGARAQPRSSSAGHDGGGGAGWAPCAAVLASGGSSWRRFHA